MNFDLSGYTPTGPARAAAPRRRPRPVPRYRPALEGLECRTVPSASPFMPPVAVAVQLATPAAHVTTVLPLTVTSVAVQDGQLVATGQLGSYDFAVPLCLAAAPSEDGSCRVLDLALDPIHLDLLGLQVDTSPICLSITAVPGPGNPLGTLLCDLATQLGDGADLGSLLGGLSADDLDALTAGLQGVLAGALDQLTAAALSGASCDDAAVLSLAVGPVDLHILGLDVHLDNCDGGPVTLDVTADPDTVLGGLICDLAGLLDGDEPDPAAVDAELAAIAGEILTLI